MGRFWQLLNALLADVAEADQRGHVPSAPPVISPAVVSRVVVGPQSRAVVEKVRRPAWDEKEWARQSDGSRIVYAGDFRVRHAGRLRRFPGRVIESRSELTAYIADPPPEIRDHPKGPCFAMTQPPWFRVHWRVAPKDVDNAILYVETVLDESLNR